MTFYTLHAVRDSDGGQFAAIKKGKFSYARHAVGDGDGGHVAATIEGIASYARHFISYFFIRNGAWNANFTGVGIRVPVMNY